MKIPTVLMLVVIVATACHKTVVGPVHSQNGLSLPPVLAFEIVDKSGNSLVHSKNDAVFVTYIDSSNTSHKVALEIRSLYSNPTDTTSAIISKYNGLFVADYFSTNVSLMGLSSFQSVHDFNLYLNGVNLGVMKINYPSVRSVTFNNIAAPIDTSVGYVGNNSDLGYYLNMNLFQVAK
jgi:hypothetical protein